jgi:hypothetical protein
MAILPKRKYSSGGKGSRIRAGGQRKKALVRPGLVGLAVDSKAG